MVFKLPLWLLLFTVAFKECYAVDCYECSWEESEAKQTSQDKKKKDKEKYMIDLVEREDAVDYPLVSPFLKGDEDPFKGNQLETYCKPALDCRYCVRWLLLDNNIKKNVTFMCVKNSKDGIVGHFTQKMGNGVVKDVLVCDKDFCNHSGGTILSSSLFLILLLSILLCTRQ